MVRVAGQEVRWLGGWVVRRVGGRTGGWSDGWVVKLVGGVRGVVRQVGGQANG